MLPSQKEIIYLFVCLYDIDVNWNCVQVDCIQVILILLQNTCFNDGDVNLVQFLQEIASEQQFEVTYVDIEEKSISGKLISVNYITLKSINHITLKYQSYNIK